MDAPARPTAAYGDVPVLDAVATRTDDGGLAVFVVNRSLEDSLDVEIDLAAFAPWSSARPSCCMTMTRCGRTAPTSRMPSSPGPTPVCPPATPPVIGSVRAAGRQLGGTDAGAVAGLTPGVRTRIGQGIDQLAEGLESLVMDERSRRRRGSAWPRTARRKHGVEGAGETAGLVGMWRGTAACSTWCRTT